MIILRALLLLLLLLLLAVAGFYVFWPQQPLRQYEPVYSNVFQSRLEFGDSIAGSSGLVGQVQNIHEQGIPALVRLYRQPRIARKIDIAGQQYTDQQGRFAIEVEPGQYEVLIYKGPEYEYFLHPLEITAGRQEQARIELARIINMAQLGWFGGDPHQHSGFHDGKDPLDKLMVYNAGVGLHFSVQTDHDRVGQNPIARAFVADAGLDTDSGYPYLVVGGDEITTSIGHMNVWEPLDERGDYIHIDDSAPAADASPGEKHVALDRIRGDMDRYALFSAINHPFAGNVINRLFGDKRSDSFVDVDYDWLENRERILAFDATETWNGGSGFMDSMYYFGADVSHPFEAMEHVFHEWFRLLNTGARFPSLGSSDTHDAYGSKYIEGYDRLVEGARTLFLGRLPVLSPQLAYTLFQDLEAALLYQQLDAVEYQLEEIGLLPGTARTYIYTGGELSAKALADNIEHSFITNGPLLFIELDGAMPGQAAPAMDRNTLAVTAVSHKPLARMLVISDGELVFEKALDNYLKVDEEIELDLRGRKWLLVYVEGQDNYAHAFTNPIYLD